MNIVFPAMPNFKETEEILIFESNLGPLGAIKKLRN